MRDKKLSVYFVAFFMFMICSLYTSPQERERGVHANPRSRTVLFPKYPKSNPLSAILLSIIDSLSYSSLSRQEPFVLIPFHFQLPTTKTFFISLKQSGVIRNLVFEWTKIKIFTFYLWIVSLLKKAKLVWYALVWS